MLEPTEPISPAAAFAPVADRAAKPGLLARALLALIRGYQHTLSPVLPALLGPACGCRFAPTCSHYAAEAVRTHGAFAGAWLAVVRLGRCTPLSAGGYDPVPPARPRRMRVERVAPRAQALPVS